MSLDCNYTIHHSLHEIYDTYTLDLTSPHQLQQQAVAGIFICYFVGVKVLMENV